MKYAVVYLSDTGNTKNLAKEIYVSLSGDEKVIVDAKNMTELPEADFYFLGFPIKKRTCGIEIMDILEQLGDVKIALFASCGLPVKEKYKQFIENAVMPWINDESDYRGLYLCQGTISDKFRKKLGENYSDEEVAKICDMASEHPTDSDIDRLYEFVESVIK